MKYLSILTPALTSLCLLTSCNALATDRTNVPAVKEARWFEIEVILFKHISNNSENNEQFSSNDLRAKKQKALDLLAHYLQPDITSLKQLLPSCEQQEIKLPYNITPSILWADSVDSENNETDGSDAEKTPLLSENESAQDDSSIQLDHNKEAISSDNMSVTFLSDDKTKQDFDQQSKQAQYATIELPVYNQYPINSQMPLCVIPTEFFQQHLNSEQLEHFSVDGFPVEKLKNTVNGLEQWQDDETGEITWASKTPYLISQDSLRLKSIANRIKRARNYAPLLHLGWRQIGESKRKAKAINLYAGEHLDLRYQQAIANQKSDQQGLEIQAILEQRKQAEELIRSQTRLIGNENISNLAVESSEALSELSITDELRQQAKQQQLNKLFQQFSLLDIQGNKPTSASINSTVESFKNEEIMLNEETTQRIIAQLSSDITVKELPLGVNNSTENQQIATIPLQPWSIDGLFKVHLDHYLYIDTELNILKSSNATSALTAKQKLAQKQNKTSSLNKVISFKQNRRVITGEIHYFDHPNIGMIVQIRRFDPTKPADEAVSQSKK